MNAAVASAKERGTIVEIGLTNRRLNGYDVICLADGKKSECKSLILTLRKGKDPVASGRAIMKSMQTLNSGETYEEGPGGSIFVPLYPWLSK